TRYAGARPGFLVVPGEEVTMAAFGKPVHVNALCTSTTIGGGQFKSRPEALTSAVTKIRAQGGIALINHPNFGYALEPAHIASAAEAQLLDIFNGRPQVHNDGNSEHRSVEAKWQDLLDRGIMIAPAAVDDAHMFAAQATDGIPSSKPGTGWSGVAAAERSIPALCTPLPTAHLHASNGPQLE